MYRYQTCVCVCKITLRTSWKAHERNMESGGKPGESVTVMPPRRISQIHGGLAAFCRNRKCAFSSASLYPQRGFVLRVLARGTFFVFPPAPMGRRRETNIPLSFHDRLCMEKRKRLPGLKTAREALSSAGGYSGLIWGRFQWYRTARNRIRITTTGETTMAGICPKPR